MTGFETALRVGDALRALSADSRRTGPETWDVVLQNGKRIDARANVEGAWFAITTSIQTDAYADVSPWRLLSLNACLPATARFTLTARDHTPTLRVDVWLGADREIARVVDACESLLKSPSILTNHDGGDSGDSSRLDELPVDASATALEALVREFAWPHEVLNDGRVRVDIDARRERYHAILSADADGVRCSVEVLSGPALHPDAREATAVALLTAGNRMRLTRATATSAATTDRIGFETWLPRAATGADLDMALGALCAACDQLGREVRALADPDLAAAYLAVALQYQPA